MFNPENSDATIMKDIITADKMWIYEFELIIIGIEGKNESNQEEKHAKAMLIVFFQYL